MSAPFLPPSNATSTAANNAKIALGLSDSPSLVESFKNIPPAALISISVLAALLLLGTVVMVVLRIRKVRAHQQQQDTTMMEYGGPEMSKPKPLGKLSPDPATVDAIEYKQSVEVIKVISKPAEFYIDPKLEKDHFHDHKDKVYDCIQWEIYISKRFGTIWWVRWKTSLQPLLHERNTTTGGIVIPFIMGVVSLD